MTGKIDLNIKIYSIFGDNVGDGCVHLVIGCTAINILLWEEQIVLTEAVMASRGPILNTHQIYLQLSCLVLSCQMKVQQ